MKNRYGEVYDFELVREGVYKFVGNTKWCRLGGKPNTEGIDNSDLGFFDPSGGPFISEGYEIKNRPVRRIFLENNEILFEVKTCE